MEISLNPMGRVKPLCTMRNYCHWLASGDTPLFVTMYGRRHAMPPSWEMPKLKRLRMHRFSRQQHRYCRSTKTNWLGKQSHWNGLVICMQDHLLWAFAKLKVNSTSSDLTDSVRHRYISPPMVICRTLWNSFCVHWLYTAATLSCRAFNLHVRAVIWNR